MHDAYTEKSASQPPAAHDGLLPRRKFEVVPAPYRRLSSRLYAVEPLPTLRENHAGTAAVMQNIFSTNSMTIFNIDTASGLPRYLNTSSTLRHGQFTAEHSI
jgi:hypothetical protein